MIVVGKISVKAVIENGRRDIQAIYLLDKLRNKDVAYIRRIAKGIPIKIKSRQEIDQISGVKNHGGYALACSKRKSDSLDSMLKRDELRLLVLEGVRDPFNMGEIFRTALAMGFDAVLSNRYDFYDNEKIVIRASAGASEHLLWELTEDLPSRLKDLKAAGVRLVAAHRANDNFLLQDYKFPAKTGICIGGALRGLSAAVLDVVDDAVRIDYDARIALSAVASANLFMYESFRQKEVEK